MPVRTAPAVDTVTAAAQRSLAAFLANVAADERREERATALVDPIPVYGIDVDKSSPGLASAQQIGWRYLVLHSASVDAIDVGLDGGTSALLGSGTLGERLATAALFAEEMARTINPDLEYEARLLDLNLVGNSLLWLASAFNPAADLYFEYGEEPALLTRPEVEHRIAEGIAKRLATGCDDETEADG